MKYETPELTALTPAINAIQSCSATSKAITTTCTETNHPVGHNEAVAAYADWE